jgi:hypothetical protein
VGQEHAGLFYRCAKQDQSFAANGLGIFANGYWGHPAYKLPPEVNLMAVAHYLDALEWQKEIVKIHAVFGGKNPHPNYLVGGVPCSINMNEVAAINSERLNLVAPHRPGGRVRERGLHSRPARGGLVLQGLGGAWERTEPTISAMASSPPRATASRSRSSTRAV